MVKLEIGLTTTDLITINELKILEKEGFKAVIENGIVGLIREN